MVENQNSTKYIEENEIDLKELFNTILKYKFKIALFVLITIILTLIYTLSIPNSYKSEVILSPQGSQKSVGGGLSSLASLAGVSLSGASSKDPFVMMKTTLNDYTFNEKIIKKYNLVEKLRNKNNLVFAFGINDIYYLLNTRKLIEDKKNINVDDGNIFSAINNINSILSISTDKKTNLIILKAEMFDRYLAKELVDIYLREIINKIKLQDMKEIDAQIKYYNKELALTYDVSLKEQLSKSLSTLYQKKVFSQANDYYFVSKVVDSRVSYIKEKTKPKRALILVVSFVASIIFGIFIVFFIEFLRSDKENEIKNF